MKLSCLPDHQLIDIDASQTILDVLLAADVDHTHVCGGKAFCSTCRIMILDGIEHCSQPTEIEQKLTQKLDFPVHIRLACQTNVSGNVSIRRLVIDNDDIDTVEHQLAVGTISGKKPVALLLASIRGQAKFDEENFPYDVVYIMRRYFRGMKDIIEQYGGVINNYMGTRLLAVFGLEDPDRAAERAVWAGLDMQTAIQEINTYLEQLSYQPLRLSVGIHYGSGVFVPIDPAHPDRASILGEVVSKVNWTETANRDIGSDLLVSEAVYQQIQAQATIGRTRTIRHADKALTFNVIEVLSMQGEPPLAVQPLSPRSGWQRISQLWQTWVQFWTQR